MEINWLGAQCQLKKFWSTKRLNSHIIGFGFFIKFVDTGASNSLLCWAFAPYTDALVLTTVALIRFPQQAFSACHFPSLSTVLSIKGKITPSESILHYKAPWTDKTHVVHATPGLHVNKMLNIILTFTCNCKKLLKENGYHQKNHDER